MAIYSYQLARGQTRWMFTIDLPPAADGRRRQMNRKGFVSQEAAQAVDPGRQLITVVRKGTGEFQELPASTDAFVWLRLCQVEMEGLSPKGGGNRCGGRCATRYGR